MAKKRPVRLNYKTIWPVSLKTSQSHSNNKPFKVNKKSIWPVRVITSQSDSATTSQSQI